MEHTTLNSGLVVGYCSNSDSLRTGRNHGMLLWRAVAPQVAAHTLSDPYYWVKKVSNTRIYAFDSPNYPPLLEAKTSLDVDPKMLIHPPGSVPNECRLHDKLSKKVYILKVAPTITPELIRAVCDGMEGVVLETYGNGNIPIKRREIYEEIARAVRRQVLVVNVTQCINGTVLGKAIYETGLLLVECGVVPSFDMTAEAALAKLSYVLTKKELTYQQKVELMKTNIRGELYNPNHDA